MYTNEQLRDMDKGSLIGMVQALQEDKDRLDWLADKDNTIANVQLPSECVYQNIHSLRDAIDAARSINQ